MKRVARYDPACPNGHTTSLLENTLQQIVGNLQELDKNGPQITLVCSHCKTAFRFDYRNREPAEVIDEVRRGDTTLENFHAEVRQWPKVSCGRCRFSAVIRGSVRQL